MQLPDDAGSHVPDDRDIVFKGASDGCNEDKWVY